MASPFEKPHQPFTLWLEFEHWTRTPADDPADDFCNIAVTLPDGRRYAMNTWTFAFFERTRRALPEGQKFLLPPDLFVERLDRPTIQQVVSRLLARGEMRDDWLSPPGDPLQDSSTA